MADAASSLRSTDGERSGEGLHRERQAIEDRSDHESGEGERQGVSGQRLPPASERAPRTERDEHVESEHRRRQHDGQGDQRFHEKLPAPAREGDPVGQRQGRRSNRMAETTTASSMVSRKACQSMDIVLLAMRLVGSS